MDSLNFEIGKTEIGKTVALFQFVDQLKSWYTSKNFPLLTASKVLTVQIMWNYSSLPLQPNWPPIQICASQNLHHTSWFWKPFDLKIENMHFLVFVIFFPCFCYLFSFFISLFLYIFIASSLISTRVADSIVFCVRADLIQVRSSVLTKKRQAMQCFLKNRD